MAANKTSEQELIKAVLEILNDSADGISTVAGIRKALPDYFNLAADDHDESVTRSGEEMWEQQVRNLKSHSSSKENPFSNGLIEQVKKGVWKITEAGKLTLAN